DKAALTWPYPIQSWSSRTPATLTAPFSCASATRWACWRAACGTMRFPGTRRSRTSAASTGSSTPCCGTPSLLSNPFPVVKYRRRLLRLHGPEADNRSESCRRVATHRQFVATRLRTVPIPSGWKPRLLGYKVAGLDITAHLRTEGGTGVRDV